MSRFEEPGLITNYYGFPDVRQAYERWNVLKQPGALSLEYSPKGEGSITLIIPPDAVTLTLHLKDTGSGSVTPVWNFKKKGRVEYPSRCQEGYR